MDPNATLDQIRALVANLGSEDQITLEAQQLAEHFQAMDQWLTAGGFLPGDWQNAGNARGTILGMPIEPIQDDEEEIVGGEG